MLFYINIEDSSGNIYGSGPIFTARSWESAPQISRAGTFSFTMPANDERAALVQHNRVARCYHITDEGPLEIGAGVISNIGTEADDNGDTNLVVSGDDLLRELTRRQVGDLVIDDGAEGETTTGPTLVMAYAPSGWSLSGSSSTAILHQFEGESVLNALVRLAEITGESFRLGTGRQVVWMTSNADSGFRLFYGMGDYADDETGLIFRIRQETDSYEAITRIYPYGVGNGDTRTTLGTSGWTPPSGYTIDTTNNYIVVDTETADSRSERYLSFKDISNSDTLAKAAYAYLEKRVDNGEFYDLDCILDAVVYPGQTVHVVARKVDDSGTALDVDDDLIVREVMTSIDENGIRVIGMQLATVDRAPENDTTAIINQGITSRDAYTYSQPGEATGGDADTLDGYHASDFLNPQYITLQAATNLVNERILTAGTGVSFNDGGAGAALTVSADTAAIDHDALLNFVANEHIDHSAVTLTAGSGLTGGGDLTANRTFNVGAGTGISVAADSISVDESAVDHDALLNFVANEHIDHSAVTLTAGDGLDGGGDLTASRSFAVDVTDFIDTSYGLNENTNNIRINAGDGLTFDTGALVLGTPGTLSVSSSNGLTASSHTHEITSSSNPGAAANILASDASGYLELVRLGLGISPTVSLHISAAEINPLIVANAAYNNVVAFLSDDDLAIITLADDDTIVYVNAQDNYLSIGGSASLAAANLNIHRTTGRVGVGTVAPATKLHIIDSSNQLRLGYDASNYVNLSVNSGGDLTVDATGDDILLASANTLSTDHWVSQTTGWGVSYAGAGDFRSLYADELHVQAFIADIYQSLVGGIIVTKSRARLSRDFTVPFAASITGIDGDVSGASIVAVDTTSDYFSIAGDQTSLISVGDKFTVAGSTGNNGVWTVSSVSYDTNTDIYVSEDITDATVDGNITFHHHFSISGDQTTKISASDTFQINGSTGNDASYTVDSVSYDAVDGETDIYPTAVIPSYTADGIFGRQDTIYLEDLEGWEDTQVFASGDYIRLRFVDTSGGGLIVTDAWGIVSNYSNLTGGEQSWTFTATDDGAIDGSDIYAGAIALDYGQTGSGSQGVWEATVLDAAGSPYSQVATWDTVTDGEPDNFTTHVRTGNLDGISGIGTEYGIWAGQGTTVNDAYILMSDSSATIANTTLKVTASSVDRIVLDPSTPYLSVGAVAPTGYLSGDGFWVGNDSGTYKFHLGDTNGESIRWDGSSLTIHGDNSNYIAMNGTNMQFYSNSVEMIILNATTGAARFGAFADGNVRVSSDGVQIQDNGGVTKGEWQADGDIFIGSNIAVAATTYFAVFATSQTYNSESVAAGDMLIGDNSASKGNVYWDTSAGQMLFRTGDDKVIAFGTDQKIYFYNSLGVETSTIHGATSGDSIFGNAEGISVSATHASSNRHAELVAGVGGYNCGVSVDAGSVDQVGILINNNTELSVHAAYVRAYDDLRVDNGLYVGANTDPEDKSIGMEVRSGNPSTIANAAQLFAKDVSSSAELFAMDEAGNATQLSPHDPETGEWVFYSENVKTGRKVRVNMEQLVKLVEEMSGEKLMYHN